MQKSISGRIGTWNTDYYVSRGRAKGMKKEGNLLSIALPNHAEQSIPCSTWIKATNRAQKTRAS